MVSAYRVRTFNEEFMIPAQTRQECTPTKRRYSEIEDEIILLVPTKSQKPEVKLENPLLNEVIELAISKLSTILEKYQIKSETTQLLPLDKYIKEVICKSKTSFPVLLTSLIYMERFGKAFDPSTFHDSFHKLFLACLMIAWKYANDNTYKNITWSNICKEFTLKELNLMEINLLLKIDFNLTVTNDDLNAYLEENFAFEKEEGHLSSLSCRSISDLKPTSPSRRWFQFLEI